MTRTKSTVTRTVGAVVASAVMGVFGMAGGVSAQTQTGTVPHLGCEPLDLQAIPSGHTGTEIQGLDALLPAKEPYATAFSTSPTGSSVDPATLNGLTNPGVLSAIPNGVTGTSPVYIIPKGGAYVKSFSDSNQVFGDWKHFSKLYLPDPALLAQNGNTINKVLVLAASGTDLSQEVGFGIDRYDGAGGYASSDQSKSHDSSLSAPYWFDPIPAPGSESNAMRGERLVLGSLLSLANELGIPVITVNVVGDTPISFDATEAAAVASVTALSDNSLPGNSSLYNPNLSACDDHMGVAGQQCGAGYLQESDPDKTECLIMYANATGQPQYDGIVMFAAAMNRVVDTLEDYLNAQFDAIPTLSHLTADFTERYGFGNSKRGEAVLMATAMYPEWKGAVGGGLNMQRGEIYDGMMKTFHDDFQMQRAGGIAEIVQEGDSTAALGSLERNVFETNAVVNPHAWDASVLSGKTVVTVSGTRDGMLNSAAPLVYGEGFGQATTARYLKLSNAMHTAGDIRSLAAVRGMMRKAVEGDSLPKVEVRFSADKQRIFADITEFDSESDIHSLALICSDSHRINPVINVANSTDICKTSSEIVDPATTDIGLDLRMADWGYVAPMTNLVSSDANKITYKKALPALDLDTVSCHVEVRVKVNGSSDDLTFVTSPQVFTQDYCDAAGLTFE